MARELRDPYEQMSSLIQTISGVADIAGKAKDRKERRMAEELQSWQTNMGLQFERIDPYGEDGNTNINNFINNAQSNIDEFSRKYPGRAQFISALGNNYIYGANKYTEANEKYDNYHSLMYGDPDNTEIIPIKTKFENIWNSVNQVYDAEGAYNEVLGMFNENQVVTIDGREMTVGDFLNSAKIEIEGIGKQLETITKESIFSKWDKRKDFMLGDFGTDLLRYKRGLTAVTGELGSSDSITKSEFNALNLAIKSGDWSNETGYGKHLNHKKVANNAIMVGAQTNLASLKGQLDNMVTIRSDDNGQLIPPLDLRKDRDDNPFWTDFEQRFADDPNMKEEDYLGWTYVDNATGDTKVITLNEFSIQANDLQDKIIQDRTKLLTSSGGAQDIMNQWGGNISIDANGNLLLNDLWHGITPGKGGKITTQVYTGPSPISPPGGFVGDTFPNAIEYIAQLSSNNEIGEMGNFKGKEISTELGGALRKEISSLVGNKFRYAKKPSENLQENITKSAKKIAELWEEKYNIATDWRTLAGLKSIATKGAPPRPVVPVAEETEFFDEDIVIEDTDFETWDDWEAPPPIPGQVPEEEVVEEEVVEEVVEEEIPEFVSDVKMLEIAEGMDWGDESSIENFQKAYNNSNYAQYGTKLVVDGMAPPGSKTEKAITSMLKKAGKTPEAIDVSDYKNLKAIERQNVDLHFKEFKKSNKDYTGTSPMKWFNSLNDEAKVDSLALSPPTIKEKKKAKDFKSASVNLSDSTDIILGGKNIDEFIGKYFNEQGTFNSKLKDEFKEEISTLLKNNKYTDAHYFHGDDISGQSLRQTIERYLRASKGTNKKQIANYKKKLIKLLSDYNKDWGPYLEAGGKTGPGRLGEILFKEEKPLTIEEIQEENARSMGD